MTERDKKPGPVTRRHFIQKTGALGAGVAFTPFVLDLSACSSDDAAPPAVTPPASSPPPAAPTPATAGSPSAPAAGSGITASAGTGTPSAGSGTSAGGSPAAGAGGEPVARNSSGSGGDSSGAGTGGAPAASNPTTAPTSNAIEAGAVLFGLYKGDGASALSEAAKRLDFSWLKPGDTVLIKVATNSQQKHPTTTSPAGVKAMIQELKMRGAGKVIVGDQAGVEHVRNSARGRSGKTSDCWTMSGMAAAVMAGAGESHLFDDQPFDTGYFSATLPDGNHWPRGMYLPSVIKEVDHIIYMPRIGQHILAGLTLGHKSAIGWLRDDSRHDLHNDAMYFYEKYTEVSYTQEIKDRFRMVVTVSEAVLLHGGPDTGTNYKLDPVLVTASSSLANHDAVNSGVLVTLDKTVTTVDPGTMTYSAASAPSNNALFANGSGVATGAAGAWTSGSSQTRYTAHQFEQGITKDRAIARGWELAGGKPSSIKVIADGQPADMTLQSGVTSHGEGILTFS